MTQGLISVLSCNQVIMKIIVGCNGYNIKKVVEQIKKEWPISLEKAYEIALLNEFGSKDDLVVMDDNREVFDGDGDLDSRYRETFTNPEFNPRWEIGISDNLEIIEI
jgi:hypothetical protein